MNIDELVRVKGSRPISSFVFNDDKTRLYYAAGSGMLYAGDIKDNKLINTKKKNLSRGLIENLFYKEGKLYFPYDGGVTVYSDKLVHVGDIKGESDFTQGFSKRVKILDVSSRDIIVYNDRTNIYRIDRRTGKIVDLMPPKEDRYCKSDFNYLTKETVAYNDKDIYSEDLGGTGGKKQIQLIDIDYDAMRMCGPENKDRYISYIQLDAKQGDLTHLSCVKDYIVLLYNKDKHKVAHVLDKNGVLVREIDTSVSSNFAKVHCNLKSNNLYISSSPKDGMRHINCDTGTETTIPDIEKKGNLNLYYNNIYLAGDKGELYVIKNNSIVRCYDMDMSISKETSKCKKRKTNRDNIKSIGFEL